MSTLTAVDEKLVTSFATYGNYRSWLEDRFNGVTQHTLNEPSGTDIATIMGPQTTTTSSPATTECDMCLVEATLAMCRTAQSHMRRNFIPQDAATSAGGGGDKKEEKKGGNSSSAQKTTINALLRSKYRVNQAWQSQRSATAAMQFVTPKGKAAHASPAEKATTPSSAAKADMGEMSTTSTMFEYSLRSGVSPLQADRSNRFLHFWEEEELLRAAIHKRAKSLADKTVIVAHNLPEGFANLSGGAQAFPSSSGRKDKPEEEGPDNDENGGDDGDEDDVGDETRLYGFETTVNQDESAHIHVWRSRREAKQFVKVLQLLTDHIALIQASHILHVPCCVLITHQTKPVTITWLPPAMNTSPMRVHRDSVLAQVLQCLHVSLNAKLGKSATYFTTRTFPIYEGMDGLLYLVPSSASSVTKERKLKGLGQSNGGEELALKVCATLLRRDPLSSSSSAVSWTNKTEAYLRENTGFGKKQQPRQQGDENSLKSDASTANFAAAMCSFGPSGNRGAAFKAAAKQLVNISVEYHILKEKNAAIPGGGKPVRSIALNKVSKVLHHFGINQQFLWSVYNVARQELDPNSETVSSIKQHLMAVSEKAAADEKLKSTSLGAASKQRKQLQSIVAEVHRLFLSILIARSLRALVDSTIASVMQVVVSAPTATSPTASSKYGQAVEDLKADAHSTIQHIVAVIFRKFLSSPHMIQEDLVPIMQDKFGVPDDFKLDVKALSLGRIVDFVSQKLRVEFDVHANRKESPQPQTPTSPNAQSSVEAEKNNMKDQQEESTTKKASVKGDLFMETKVEAFVAPTSPLYFVRAPRDRQQQQQAPPAPPVARKSSVASVSSSPSSRNVSPSRLEEGSDQQLPSIVKHQPQMLFETQFKVLEGMVVTLGFHPTQPCLDPPDVLKRRRESWNPHALSLVALHYLYVAYFMDACGVSIPSTSRVRPIGVVATEEDEEPFSSVGAEGALRAIVEYIASGCGKPHATQATESAALAAAIASTAALQFRSLGASPFELQAASSDATTSTKLYGIARAIKTTDPFTHKTSSAAPSTTSVLSWALKYLHDCCNDGILANCFTAATDAAAPKDTLFSVAGGGIVGPMTPRRLCHGCDSSMMIMVYRALLRHVTAMAYFKHMVDEFLSEVSSAASAGSHLIVSEMCRTIGVFAMDIATSGLTETWKMAGTNPQPLDKKEASQRRSSLSSFVSVSSSHSRSPTNNTSYYMGGEGGIDKDLAGITASQNSFRMPTLIPSSVWRAISLTGGGTTHHFGTSPRLLSVLLKESMNGLRVLCEQHALDQQQFLATSTGSNGIDGGISGQEEQLASFHMSFSQSPNTSLTGSPTSAFANRPSSGAHIVSALGIRNSLIDSVNVLVTLAPYLRTASTSDSQCALFGCIPLSFMLSAENANLQHQTIGSSHLEPFLWKAHIPLISLAKNDQHHVGERQTSDALSAPPPDLNSTQREPKRRKSSMSTGSSLSAQLLTTLPESVEVQEQFLWSCRSCFDVEVLGMDKWGSSVGDNGESGMPRGTSLKMQRVGSVVAQKRKVKKTRRALRQAWEQFITALINGLAAESSSLQRDAAVADDLSSPITAEDPFDSLLSNLQRQKSVAVSVEPDENFFKQYGELRQSLGGEQGGKTSTGVSESFTHGRGGATGAAGVGELMASSLFFSQTAEGGADLTALANNTPKGMASSFAARRKVLFACQMFETLQTLATQPTSQFSPNDGSLISALSVGLFETVEVVFVKALPCLALTASALVREMGVSAQFVSFRSVGGGGGGMAAPDTSDLTTLTCSAMIATHQLFLLSRIMRRSCPQSVLEEAIPLASSSPIMATDAKVLLVTLGVHVRDQLFKTYAINNNSAVSSSFVLPPTVVDANALQKTIVEMYHHIKRDIEVIGKSLDPFARGICEEDDADKIIWLLRRSISHVDDLLSVLEGMLTARRRRSTSIEAGGGGVGGGASINTNNMTSFSFSATSPVIQNTINNTNTSSVSPVADQPPTAAESREVTFDTDPHPAATTTRNITSAASNSSSRGASSRMESPLLGIGALPYSMKSLIDLLPLPTDFVATREGMQTEEEEEREEIESEWLADWELLLVHHEEVWRGVREKANEQVEVLQIELLFVEMEGEPKGRGEIEVDETDHRDHLEQLFRKHPGPPPIEEEEEEEEVGPTQKETEPQPLPPPPLPPLVEEKPRAQTPPDLMSARSEASNSSAIKVRRRSSVTPSPTTASSAAPSVSPEKSARTSRTPSTRRSTSTAASLHTLQQPPFRAGLPSAVNPVVRNKRVSLTKDGSPLPYYLQRGNVPKNEAFDAWKRKKMRQIAQEQQEESRHEEERVNHHRTVIEDRIAKLRGSREKWAKERQDRAEKETNDQHPNNIDATGRTADAFQTRFEEQRKKDLQAAEHRRAQMQFAATQRHRQLEEARKNIKQPKHRIEELIHDASVSSIARLLESERQELLAKPLPRAKKGVDADV